MKIIKDVVHDSIEINNLESTIISQSPFNRLHHIKQLGQVQAVYPSATHTRFAHSIGVMHVAGLMYQYGIANAQTDRDLLEDYTKFKYNEYRKEFEEFFSEINFKEKFKRKFGYARENSKKIPKDLNFDSGILSLIHDVFGSSFIAATAPAFLNINKIKYKKTILFEHSLVRILGLIHDLGHLPMSHLVEDAVVEFMNKEFQTNNSEDRKGFTKKALHEQLTIYAIGELFEKAYEAMVPIIEQNNNLEDETLFVFIEFISYLSTRILKKEILIDIYKIIDNDIDADKFDYIVRDGIHSSMNNIYSEVLRVIKTIQLSRKKEGSQETADTFTFTVTEKAIKNIENVLRARADLYRLVIGHHKSRKHEMLYKILISNFLTLIHRTPPKNENFLYELIAAVAKGQGRAATNIYIDYLSDEWLETWLRDMEYLLKGSSHTASAEDDKAQSGINDRQNIIELADELFGGHLKYQALWKRDYIYVKFIADKGLTEEIKERVKCLFYTMLYYSDKLNILELIEKHELTDEILYAYQLTTSLSNLSFWAERYYSCHSNGKSFYTNILDTILEEYELSKFDILLFPNYIKIPFFKMNILTETGLLPIDDLSPLNKTLIIERAFTVPFYMYASSSVKHRLNSSEVFSFAIHSITESLCSIVRDLINLEDSVACSNNIQNNENFASLKKLCVNTSCQK